MEPRGHAVARPRILHHQALEPAQRLQLVVDDAGTTRWPGTALPCPATRVSRFIGLDLFGFGEVLEALGGRELGQARQRRGRGEAIGVQQDQPRGARLVLASGRRGKLVADPGDRAAHGSQVRVLAFQPQVPLPARALVQPLGQGPHEGEMSAVQLSVRRRLGLLEASGRAGVVGHQNLHHGLREGAGSSGSSCNS